MIVSQCSQEFLSILITAIRPLEVQCLQAVAVRAHLAYELNQLAAIFISRLLEVLNLQVLQVVALCEELA